MRIIIAGGTGLIGKALARQLKQEKHEVFILSRNPNKSQQFSTQAIKLIKWNGLNTEGWGNLVDGADVIINLVGENLSEGRWTENRKRTILDSRINAGNALVDAIRSATIKPNVFLQSSAVGFYGSQGEAIISEPTKAGKDFLAKVCVEWERSTAEVEDFGIRRIITRSGVILSTEDGALPRMLRPFYFFVGGPISNGQQFFPCIHLEDEIAALIFLITHVNASGVYNLTIPNPIKNKQFAKEIGKALHRPSFFPVPAFMLHLLFGEMANMLLGSQRIIPERLLKLGFLFKFPTADEALQDLLRK